MTLFNQLPAELLDIVFHDLFLEGWIDSKVKCDLVLRLRTVSRAVDLSIQRLISADHFFRPDGGQKEFWNAFKNGYLVKGYPTVIVQQLLERVDIDLLCRHGHGQKLLSWSGYRGYDWLVQLLLEKGVDINGRDERKGRTTLHHAINESHWATVNLLLENGADTDIRDIVGETALHLAVWNEDKILIQLLLETGADVDAKDNVNDTALHNAVQQNQHETVRLLLEEGADVNARGHLNKTALHMAAEQDQHEMARLLLEGGADVNAKGHLNETALHRAVQWDQHEMAGLLLENGADFNAPGHLNEKALHKAAQ